MTTGNDALSLRALPRGTAALGLALVGFATLVVLADLARLAALAIGDGRPSLLSFANAARFLVLALERPSRLGDVASGASTPWFWATFTFNILAVVLVVGRVARVVGRAPQRGDGFAARRELIAVAGLEAARQKAKLTRPSLAGKRLSREEVGFPLGRSLRPDGVELIANWECSLELVAPPGAGKTLRVLARILRQHPGSCLATATKPDLYEVSARARERVGEVVALDPDGLVPAAAPLRWSPVAGCAESAVATRRAGALVAASGEAADLRSASFFRNSAIAVLACYLRAAALEGGTIADVAAWAARPSDPAPLRILSTHDEGGIDWASRLHRHVSGAEETTSGVMRSVDLALSPFHHERVLALSAIAAADSFDLEAALSAPVTIYALGKERAASSVGAGPLVTAFCDELLTTAERASATRPGRRLDPPLLALLDEAPSIVPLPGLPRLVADGRGRGITTVLAMQSHSQAVERWGTSGAQTIRNAATITAVLGGLSVSADLEELSRLSGTHRTERRSVSEEASGGRSSTQTSQVDEPVLSPAEIHGLKSGELLLFWGSLPPVLAYAPGTWEGPDAQAIATDEALSRSLNDEKRGAPQ
jgi:type IV secretory pathway TraG/TraD family ATPase VirD4